MNGSILLYDPEAETSAFFDYRTPDPAAVTVGALALGMASIVRFRGMTGRPITNDEHSLRVARFALELASELGPKGKALAYLWGLLHDAHEVLTPWADCPGPWKTDDMRVVEGRLDSVVWESLRLYRVLSSVHVGSLDETVPAELRDIVHQADKAALAFEALLWQPGAEQWVFEDQEYLLALDPRLFPLAAPRPGEDWTSELRRACGEVVRRSGLPTL